MGFEWLFKYSRSAYERGEWTFANELGVFWWIAAVGLLALSFAFGRRMRGWPLLHRAPVHILQLAAAVVILTLLAAPALEVERLAPGVNTVAMLVDASASMALAAGAGSEPTRLDAAKRLIEEDIRLPAEGEVRTALFHFGNRLHPAASLDALQATGEGSRLVDALTDLAAHYDQGALAAVVVLTDGAQNGGDRTDLEDLAATGVPVHAVALGPAAIADDIELQDVLLPPRVAPNTQVTARLVISHETTAGSVRVRIRDGRSVLAAETVALDPRTPIVTEDIVFASGSAGLKELAVELSAPASDPLPGNNTRSHLLDVAASRYRVLYLEGEPRWEFKFIRRAVAEDDAIDLATWLRTTPRKTYRQGVAGPDQLAEGFPASLEALYDYHLVILGSLPATALDDRQHDWLEAYVAERGGSLLALAGRNALADGGWDVKPLARALPVVLERPAPDAAPAYAALEYAAHPTAAGLASDLIDIGSQSASQGGAAGQSPGAVEYGLTPLEEAWASLPMLADYQRLGPPKLGATVYLEAQGNVRVERGAVIVRGGGARPLLVAQPYGFGRSAVLATASTWRWRMRTPADDPRHSLFWRQLVRHLASAAAPQRRLSVAAQGGALNLRVAWKNARFDPLADATVTARITPPDGAAFETSLPWIGSEGAFGKTVAAIGGSEQMPPGIYRVDVTAQVAGGLGTAETVTRLAQVGTRNLEHFGAARNDALLARIATATGGQVWRPDDLAGLREAIAFTGAGIRERHRLPLWDAPFFYLLLVLLKCAEWSLRRIWGGI